MKRAGAVLDALEAHGGSAELETLRDLCGDEVSATLSAMKRAGAVICETAAQRKVGDRTRRMVSLAADAGELLSPGEGRRISPQRRDVIMLLAAAGCVPAQEVCYFTGVGMSTLRNMEKAGLVTFSQEEALRLPPPRDVPPGPPIVLSDEQQAAFSQILSLTRSQKPEAVLLQGVTGSGKTQVYLRLVQEVLSAGRTAIVLVPEIVLTPQMMRKFASYFGDRVAMLHSGLRMTERYDQWKRIRRGEVQVVLGTRSAVFAPLKKSGAHRAGRGAGEQLSVGKSPPLPHPGHCQVPVCPPMVPCWCWGPPPRRWRPPGRRNRDGTPACFCAALSESSAAPGADRRSASGDPAGEPRTAQ